jgi:hypothetical protein
MASSLTSTPAATGTLRRPVGLMLLFTLLSWLGEYVHNLFELPQLTMFSPENSIPALISLVLFTMWWLTPARQAAVVLLLVWALLHLIGGGVLSVIPFGFLPFYPDQTLDHYVAHAVYVVAQLPLIGLLLKQMRAR